jgi:DNA-binding CsgD family transcriptional regulator
LTSEPIRTHGFSPEPDHGALLTGLLETVAADAPPVDQLAGSAAAGVAELIGDACLLCVLAGGERTLQPLAVADRDESGEALLRPLVSTPALPGRRPELGPYVARYELADELIAPLRARGRVVGELVALRRGDSRPFTASEKRTLQAVADLVALGLGERRQAAPRADVPAPDKLSRREREVLALLALGHTNREIAEQVHLSIRTVEWHRARIQAKLRVTGRAALAQVARAHGLLSDTDTEG